MAIEIIEREVETLVPDPLNARTHSKEQIAKLVKLIERFGFNNPIALKPDCCTIGAGNGRWHAAKFLKMKTVPTITLAHLSEDEWLAYAIADNRVALDAGWNEDVLKASLAHIHAKLGNVVDLTAMRPKELAIRKIGDFTLPKVKFEPGDSKFEIIIECESEAAQAELLSDLMERGLKCRALL